MKKRERWVLTVSLVALDTLAVGLALLLAYYLRIGSGLLRYGQPHDFTQYLRMIGWAIPVFLLLCVNARLYDPQQLLGGPQEYAHVVKVCTFGVLVLIVLTFYERDFLLSRGWLLMAWVLSIALMGGFRFGFRRVILHLRRRSLFVTRTLVVGANEQAKTIVRQFQGSKRRGVVVVGFLDDYLPPGTPVLDDLEVLGSPSELERLIAETGSGGAIIVPGALAWESFEEIIRKTASSLDGIELKLSPGFYEILTTGVQVDHTTFVPLLTLDRVRITGLDALLKNVLDYGLGGVLLVLTAPLMGLLALAIGVLDGRPVLVRHRALGLRGQPFETVRFRIGLLGSTRRGLADQLPVDPSKAEGTSRLGSLLYRTGLDKLPQLVNVMQGHMSLVGPRTISVGGVEPYGPWLSSMLTVKPGMTGTWAVRNSPALDDEIRLSIYYIRNWTIWFDAQVLFQTLWHVLGSNGLRRSRAKGSVAADAVADRPGARPRVWDAARRE